MTDRAKAAQADLRRYKTAKRELRRIKEDIATIRSRLMSTSRPARDADIQYVFSPWSVEKQLAALADLKEFYDAKSADVMRLCMQLERQIDRVSGLGALILRMHYIDGIRIDHIARRFEYSIRQVIRLHMIALEEYEKTALHVIDDRDTMAM